MIFADGIAAQDSFKLITKRETLSVLKTFSPAGRSHLRILTFQALTLVSKETSCQTYPELFCSDYL